MVSDKCKGLRENVTTTTLCLIWDHKDEPLLKQNHCRLFPLNLSPRTPGTRQEKVELAANTLFSMQHADSCIFLYKQCHKQWLPNHRWLLHSTESNLIKLFPLYIFALKTSSTNLWVNKLLLRLAWAFDFCGLYFFPEEFCKFSFYI